VKTQFKPQLEEAVRGQLADGKERGFSVCVRGNKLEPNPIVVGQEKTVTIPHCDPDETRIVIHSHPVSKEIEEKWGTKIAHSYYGSPSSMDLRSGVNGKYGCVVTDKQLSCWKQPITLHPEVAELLGKELQGNITLAQVESGEAPQQAFKQAVMDTVKAQNRALESTGAYCRIRL
jgi:hypothetical protein